MLNQLTAPTHGREITRWSHLDGLLQRGMGKMVGSKFVMSGAIVEAFNGRNITLSVADMTDDVYVGCTVNFPHTASNADMFLKNNETTTWTLTGTRAVDPETYQAIVNWRVSLA